MNNSGQGTVKEEASAFAERVEGNVKDAYGAVTGDAATEREGEFQAAQGEQRQEQNRMLTGLFNDRESTDRAYQSARSRGYNDDEINLMMTDQTRDTWFDDDDDSELGNKALEGAGAGGLTGGLVGALIGSGMPEDRAKLYYEGVRNCCAVVRVTPRNDEDAT